jgi:GTP-binding protein YchF
LETLERRIEKGSKAIKADKSQAKAIEFCKRLRKHLEAGQPARTYPANEEEKMDLDEAILLTGKPVIYACNFCEQDFADSKIEENDAYRQVAQIAAAEHAELLPICAELEAQAAEFSPEEKAEFLAELGVARGGLDLLVQKSYTLLGQISFLTAGEPEVRAWTITKGTKAPQAAGKIHSDIERGFIRAEVIAYDELIRLGSLVAAKEKGEVRSEGKEYVMQDGDVVLFRFNV